VNVSGVFTATYLATPGQVAGGTSVITAVYDVAGTDPNLLTSTSAGFNYTVAAATSTTTLSALPPQPRPLARH